MYHMRSNDLGLSIDLLAQIFLFDLSAKETLKSFSGSYPDPIQANLVFVPGYSLLILLATAIKISTPFLGCLTGS